MISQPTRAVPSKRALSYLRQVVLYSSFGTAAGAGLLLAEERRRRICVAKKVVDNARRIRESNRYVHREAVREGDYGDRELCLVMANPLSASEIEKAYEKAAEMRKSHETRGRTRRARFRREGVGHEEDRPGDFVRSLERQKSLDRTPKAEAIEYRERRTRFSVKQNFLNVPPPFYARPPTVPKIPRRMPEDSSLYVGHVPKEATQEEMNTKTWSPSVEHQGTQVPVQEEATEGFGSTDPPVPLHHNAHQRGFSSVHDLDLPGRILKEFYLTWIDTYSSTTPVSARFPPSSDDAAVYRHAYDLLKEAPLQSVVECFDKVVERISMDKPENERNYFQVSEIGSVLLELSAKPTLVDQVQRLWRNLKGWNRLRPISALAVQRTCQGLLQDGQTKEAFRLFYATVGNEDKLEVLRQPESFSKEFVAAAFDAILLDNIQDDRVHRLMHAVVPLEEAAPLWVSKVRAKFEELLESSAWNKSDISLQAAEKASALFKKAIVVAIKFDPEFFRIAERLMSRMASKGQNNVAYDLFDWLTASHGLDQGCLGRLIQEFAMNKDHALVSKLYLRYRDQAKFSPESRLAICYALAVTAPYEKAVYQICLLIKQSAEQPSPAVYPLATTMLLSDPVASENEEKMSEVCRNALVKLLQRCWKETESLATVESLFQQIRDLAGPCELPSELYATLRNIRMLSGELLPQRTGQDGLARVRQDLGLLGTEMLLKAYKCDWLAVRDILARVHATGLSGYTSGAIAEFFNPTFREYSKHHTPLETRAFLTHAMKHYSIIPDQMTLDITLEGFIKERQIQAIEPWIRWLNEQGLRKPLQLNGHSVYNLFNRYFLERRPSHTLFYNMLMKLHNWHTKLIPRELWRLLKDAVSYELRKCRLGVSDSSKLANHLKYIRYRHEEALPLPKGGLQLKLHIGRIDKLSKTSASLTGRTGKDVESEMLFALSEERPSEALELYTHALQAGLPVTMMCFEVAVEASLRSNRGDPAAALELINDAKARGINVDRAIGPLLLHQIYAKKMTEDELYARVTDFYQMMDENNIPVKHYIAISAVNSLLNKGNAREALRLMEGVITSQWAERRPLDIVAMTVFLNAYTKLNHLGGIKWVVQYVLSKDLRIDLDFVKALCNSRRSFRKTVQMREEMELAEPSEYEHDFVRLDNWVKVCKARLNDQKRITHELGWELVTVIKELYSGIPTGHIESYRPKKRKSN